MSSQVLPLIVFDLLLARVAVVVGVDVVASGFGTMFKREKKTRAEEVEQGGVAYCHETRERTNVLLVDKAKQKRQYLDALSCYDRGMRSDGSKQKEERKTENVAPKPAQSAITLLLERTRRRGYLSYRVTLMTLLGGWCASRQTDFLPH